MDVLTYTNTAENTIDDHGSAVALAVASAAAVVTSSVCRDREISCSAAAVTTWLSSITLIKLLQSYLDELRVDISDFNTPYNATAQTHK